MSAPTQRLTDRAETILGEEVALAVRVRKTTTERAKKANDHKILGLEDRPSAPVTFPAGGFPIVAIVRSIKRTASDVFLGQHELTGVLAFTRAGDRVLMGRSRFRSLRPTKVIRRFPASAAPSVDERLLADDLIPELAIDGERFLVNSVDFKVLTKAVVTGQIEARYLAAQLKPFYHQSQALARYDPHAIWSSIRGR